LIFRVYYDSEFGVQGLGVVCKVQRPRLRV
jgi:hypothetical protein